MFIDGARLVIDFAFGLGVHRLEARAAVRTARQRRAPEARRGAGRRAAGSFLRNGEYLDQALWTILADEWLEAKCRRPRSSTSSRHLADVSRAHPRQPPRANMTVAGMDVRDFDFDLPPDLIAQEPAAGTRRVAPARP